MHVTVSKFDKRWGLCHGFSIWNFFENFRNSFVKQQPHFHAVGTFEETDGLLNDLIRSPSSLVIHKIANLKLFISSWGVRYVLLILKTYRWYAWLTHPSSQRVIALLYIFFFITDVKLFSERFHSLLPRILQRCMWVWKVSPIQIRFDPLFVFSHKPKRRIKFSARWWSDNEKYFCFFFIASRTLHQSRT